MWNHGSDLIKSGPIIFNICLLVDLTYSYTDIDLGVNTLNTIDLEFIKCALVYYGVFSIDRNDTHIFLSQFRKLMTGW